MHFASRIDEFGKPAWIALTILGFVAFWPVGLGILAFLIGSGRMGCWRQGYAGHEGHEGGRFGGWQSHWQSHWERHRERHCGPRQRSSGNRAFDEYRAETLRRLEEEEKEFREFLDRLRFAKDKAEFDEFLNARRNQPEEPRPQA